jgi:hypothetical protein
MKYPVCNIIPDGVTIALSTWRFGLEAGLNLNFMRHVRLNCGVLRLLAH